MAVEGPLSHGDGMPPVSERRTWTARRPIVTLSRRPTTKTDAE